MSYATHLLQYFFSNRSCLMLRKNMMERLVESITKLQFADDIDGVGKAGTRSPC